MANTYAVNRNRFLISDVFFCFIHKRFSHAHEIKEEKEKKDNTLKETENKKKTIRLHPIVQM